MEVDSWWWLSLKMVAPISRFLEPGPLGAQVQGSDLAMED